MDWGTAKVVMLSVSRARKHPSKGYAIVEKHTQSCTDLRCTHRGSACNLTHLGKMIQMPVHQMGSEVSDPS